MTLPLLVRVQHFFFIAVFVLLLHTHTSSAVDLPFGEINVVVVTDVHSWVGGRAVHEGSALDANYGDILSFYERLKELEADKDIFFVMNGDFMDGTGLSTYPPTHLTPILRFMPWDAVTIGNHELYRDVNVEYMTQKGGFVSHWNGKYLTSNVLMANTNEPIGSRFTYLQGKNSTVLTFGFLYDMQNNCNTTIVETVEQAVQSDWFADELSKGDFDAILVLAHMGVDDPLVNVILNATRAIVGPNVPVQFITGHTHVRDNQLLDDRASSFEPGHYLDTLGFCSFPSKHGVRENVTADFKHVFIDANVKTLKGILGIDEMSTSSGSALSSLIHETQKDLGLLNVVGCSPQTFLLLNGLEERQSLWALYLYEVVMHGFFRYNQSKVLIQSTGAFRYDLYQGNVTVDDVIAVSPYNDSWYKISERMLGADILLAFDNLSRENNTLHPELPEWVMSGAILPDLYYDVFSESFVMTMLSTLLSNITGTYYEPMQVFTRAGVAVTTTQLWFDFVSNYWSCDNPAAVQVTNRWMLVAFSAIVAAAFFGWRFWAKRYFRQGYDNAVPVEEEDDGILL
jgi:2',3'-cyclic-nucleotide 2'-phosphodiesterase (5'-nucleotidase family)